MLECIEGKEDGEACCKTSENQGDLRFMLRELFRAQKGQDGVGGGSVSTFGYFGGQTPIVAKTFRNGARS